MDGSKDTETQPLVSDQKYSPISVFHMVPSLLGLILSSSLTLSLATFGVFFSKEMALSYHQFIIAVSARRLGSVFTPFVMPIATKLQANHSLFLLITIMSATTMLLAAPFGNSVIFVAFILLETLFGTCMDAFFAISMIVSSNFTLREYRRATCGMMDFGLGIGGSSGYIIVGLFLHFLPWQYIFIIMGFLMLPLGAVILFVIPPVNPFTQLAMEEIDSDDSGEQPDEHEAHADLSFGQSMFMIANSSILMLHIVSAFAFTMAFMMLVVVIGKFFGDFSEATLTAVTSSIVLAEFFAFVALFMEPFRSMSSHATVSIGTVIQAVSTFILGILAESIGRSIGPVLAFFLVFSFSFGGAFAMNRIFVLIIDSLDHPKLINYISVVFSVGMGVGAVILPPMLPLGFPTIFYIITAVSCFSLITNGVAWSKALERRLRYAEE